MVVEVAVKPQKLWFIREQRHYIYDLSKVNRSLFPVCVCDIVQRSLLPCVTLWKVRQKKYSKKFAMFFVIHEYH